MVQVRFTSDHEGRRAGTTTDLPEEQARRAIDAGRAEELASEPDDDKTMRVRFRKGATIANVGYGAGQAAVVPQSEEAWRAVNDGLCDLDPAPGVADQPFPPEWVQRSEATEAPVAPVPVQVMLPPGSTLTPSAATASAPRRGAAAKAETAQTPGGSEEGAETPPRGAEEGKHPPIAGGTDVLPPRAGQPQSQERTPGGTQQPRRTR